MGEGQPGRAPGHGCGCGGELGSLASALMVGKRVDEPRHRAAPGAADLVQVRGLVATHGCLMSLEKGWIPPVIPSPVLTDLFP